MHILSLEHSVSLFFCFLAIIAFFLYIHINARKKICQYTKHNVFLLSLPWTALDKKKSKPAYDLRSGQCQEASSRQVLWFQQSCWPPASPHLWSGSFRYCDQLQYLSDCLQKLSTVMNPRTISLPHFHYKIIK